MKTNFPFDPERLRSVKGLETNISYELNLKIGSIYGFLNFESEADEIMHSSPFIYQGCMFNTFLFKTSNDGTISLVDTSNLVEINEPDYEKYLAHATNEEAYEVCANLMNIFKMF